MKFATRSQLVIHRLKNPQIYLHTCRFQTLLARSPIRRFWSFQERSQNSKDDYSPLHICPSFRPPAPLWNKSAPTGCFFMKFNIRTPSKNLSRNLKCHQNLTRKTGPLHEDLCTFMIVSHSIFLITKNISDKSVEKIKTRILCPTIFNPETSTVYAIM